MKKIPKNTVNSRTSSKTKHLLTRQNRQQVLESSHNLQKSQSHTYFSTDASNFQSSKSVGRHLQCVNLDNSQVSTQNRSVESKKSNQYKSNDPSPFIQNKPQPLHFSHNTSLNTLNQGDKTAKFSSIQAIRVEDTDRLIDIKTHQFKQQPHIYASNELYSSHQDEKTPETCRQTALPVSATIMHNASVSTQGQFYHPRTGSFSQTSQYSPAPFNSNTQIYGNSQATSPSYEQNNLFKMIPGSYDWNQLIRSLDLFYRERQVKLCQTISQLKSTSSDDVIIRTMLENKETLAFADQRLTELIKDGISLEQELLIESLQKQVFLSQQQVSSVGSQKEQLVREVSRYQEEFTAIKQEQEMLQQKFAEEILHKKHKNKVKRAQLIQQIQEIQSAKKQEKEQLNDRIRDIERQMDSMLSHNKYEHIGIEGLNARIQDMNEYINLIKKQNTDLQKTVDTLQTALSNETSRFSQSIEELSQQHKDEKKSLKKQIQQQYDDLNMKHQSELHELSTQLKHEHEASLAQRSEQDRQLITQLHHYNEDLKKTSIAVSEHETIVNREIEKVVLANQYELEAIKIAFEKELRKAEKQLRDSARKDEKSVRAQLTESLALLESAKRENEKNEDKFNAQISELKEIVRRLEQENNDTRTQNASIIDEYEAYQTDVNKEQIRNELLIKEYDERIKQLETETSATQELSQLVTSLQQEVKKQQIELKVYQQNRLVSFQDQIRNISQEHQMLAKLLKSELQLQSRDCMSHLNHSLQTLLQKTEKKLAQKESIIRIMQQQQSSLQFQFENQENSHNQRIQHLEFVQREQLSRLENEVLGERNQKEHLNNQIFTLKSQLDQARIENITYQERLTQANQHFQDLDFKLKSQEVHHSSLQNQIQSQDQEMDRVKQQYTIKHEQVMNEFKDQCAQVRAELEQAYKAKMANKMDKYRHEYAEKREREIKLEIDYALEQLNLKINNINSENQRLKEELRKTKLKNKMLKQQEQENLSRIEEEVHQSLAKVMNQSNIHKKRQSPYTANRSYNSINLNYPQMNKSNSQFHISMPVKKNDHKMTHQVLNDITTDILNRPTHEDENDSGPYTFNRKNSSFSPNQESTKFNDHSNNSSFVVVNQSQNQWPPRQRNPLHDSTINQVQPMMCDDAFVIPQSQSPKQKTGIFGLTTKISSQQHSVDTFNHD